VNTFTWLFAKAFIRSVEMYYNFYSVLLKFDGTVNKFPIAVVNLIIIVSFLEGPPQKLIVTQLVKKFPAFYGTHRFITAFTRTHH